MELKNLTKTLSRECQIRKAGSLRCTKIQKQDPLLRVKMSTDEEAKIKSQRKDTCEDIGDSGKSQCQNINTLPVRKVEK